MNLEKPASTRVYGTRTIYGHFLTLCIMMWVTATLLFSTFSAMSNPIRQTLPSGNSLIPEYPYAEIAFVVFVWVLPVLGVLMHSPRTRTSEISVGTDQGTPALIFQQSRLIYALGVISIIAVSAALVLLLQTSPGTGYDTLSTEHKIATWALLLTVTCGWQAGVAVGMLRGRVRPGYIAIRHDGIHLRGYANDAWVPWDSICPYLRKTHHQNLIIQLAEDHHAVISSRVPRLWTHIDKRIEGHAHPSRPRERRTSVAIDRRPFRIAPEIIDAAVEYFYENPAAREELRDPAAISRTVYALRAQATTAWWRSQTRPVPLPTLTVDPHKLP